MIEKILHDWIQLFLLQYNYVQNNHEQCIDLAHKFMHGTRKSITTHWFSAPLHNSSS